MKTLFKYGSKKGRRSDSGLPSFIESSPIGEDLLEGKAQERIAENIACWIKDNKAEHKLLGLDGPWGSGKSNLVKILESKLSKSHYFFIYDAWGHQEDLQRRSFLEELTENLCKDRVIDASTWEGKLKDLLSRRQEVSTKTVPHLSTGVIATIFAVVLTPIFQALAGWVGNLWGKLFITAIPILLAIAVYCFASKKDGNRLSISEIYMLYKDKELSKETYVTVSEKKPSVREFQNWMGQLSDALVEKKLVVVFDNMDRLPPEKVRELWSSIHTFFAEASFKDIWVIVPFDRNHIANAFEGEDKVSEDFLRKSFSLIFRIAPPVLTDWRKFFDLKFKDAFGESEKRELQYARKIFDCLRKEITPRDIISFINEMVSLRRIAEKEISLRYIALFVLTKKKILAEPVNEILSGEYLEGAKAIFAGDEDLPNHIAALVYQAPLASASQVMLSREIQNSLNEQDTQKLNKLASHPHSVDILEQVVMTGYLNLNNAVPTLAKLDGQNFSATSGDRIADIWDDLCAKATEEPVTGQTFTHTHELLLERCSTARRMRFVRHLIKEIRDADDFQGERYYKALSELYECIEKNELNIDLLSMVTEIKKPPKDFIAYVSVSRNNYKRFKLKCEESELQKYIIERISYDLTDLSIISVVAADYDFTPVVQDIEKKIESDFLTVQNVGPFYQLYKALSKEKPIKMPDLDRVANFLTGVQSGSETQLDLLAMRLAAGQKFPYSDSIDKSMLHDTDESTAAKIAERIEYFENYVELLLNYLSWQQPILKNVLRNLTLNEYDTSKLDITSVLENYSSLQASLGINHQDFITRLNSRSQYAEGEITEKYIWEHIKDPIIFEHAVKVDCNLTNYLVEMMIKVLNSLDVSEWRSALRDVGSFTYKVTYHLLDAGKLEQVPDNAIAVYKELLIKVAKGKFQMDKNDDGWQALYRRTDKRKLRPTAKNIRDIFISNIEVTPEKFLFFADLLLNHGALYQKSPDVARKILALIGEDDDCLAFIVDNASKFIPILDDAGDDSADFKDKVRQKLTTSQADERLVSFAQDIGIELET